MQTLHKRKLQQQRTLPLDSSSSREKKALILISISYVFCLLAENSTIFCLFNLKWLKPQNTDQSQHYSQRASLKTDQHNSLKLKVSEDGNFLSWVGPVSDLQTQTTELMNSYEMRFFVDIIVENL